MTISNNTDTDTAAAVVPPANMLPIDLRVHGWLDAPRQRGG
jgi:hypothetical protein